MKSYESYKQENIEIELNLLKYISETHLLKESFNYIIKKNKSIVAPYHNQIHIMNVIHTVYELCLYYNINKREKDLLLISAMFHDINHSKGKLNDEENIKKSLNEIDIFSDKNNLSEEDKGFIKDMINITQYPYKIPNSDLSLNQQILRDSDVYQIMKLDNYIGHNLIGLKYEYGKNMEWKDLLDNQNKFIDGLEFSTEYIKNKWKEKKSTIKNYQKLINNILND